MFTNSIKTTNRSTSFTGAYQAMVRQFDMHDVHITEAMFYIFCGSAADLLDSYVVDLHHVVTLRKDLYRQGTKKAINQARDTTAQLVNRLTCSLDAANRKDMWIEISSMITDELRTDITKMAWSIERALRRAGQDDGLAVMAVLCVRLAEIVVRFFKSFGEYSDKILGYRIPILVDREWTRLSGNAERDLRVVMKAIFGGRPTASQYDAREIDTGIAVIENKLADADWLDRCQAKAMQLHGIDCYRKEPCEVNNFTPWDSVQDSLVINYLPMGGLEKTAMILGRSIGAVKMRQWRLKKQLAHAK